MNRVAHYCTTCKHWGKPHLAIDRARFDIATGLRKCNAVPFYGEDNTGMPDDVTALATVHDGEGYLGELLTRAEFGCVLHEAAVKHETRSTVPEEYMGGDDGPWRVV